MWPASATGCENVYWVSITLKRKNGAEKFIEMREKHISEIGKKVIMEKFWTETFSTLMLKLL